MKTSIFLLATLALATLSPLAQADQAAETTINITDQTAGATPFISKVYCR